MLDYNLRRRPLYPAELRGRMDSKHSITEKPGFVNKKSAERADRSADAHFAKEQGSAGSEIDVLRFGAALLGENGTELGQIGVHLRGAAAGIAAAVHQLPQLGQGHAEGGIAGQTLQQVAGLACLHPGGGGHGVGADKLVELLPVAAPLHGLHHQIFGGDEGEILVDRALNDLFVDADALRHVLHQAQDGVGAEEALGQRNAAVGGIVQRPLHPLDGGGHGSVEGVGHEIAGQRADALRAHGIALVGHGGGTDLGALKGLFHLTVVLEEAHVVGKTAAALGDGGQHVEDAAVELAGIGLTGDREAAVEAELGGDHAVHLVDAGLVALEEIQEAGLGARGAPAAQKAEGGQHEVQLLQIKLQVLQPEGGALAHRHELGGLIMGVAQRGEGFIFLRKGGQIFHHVEKLAAEITQTVAVKDEVGVVGDIAGGGTQMDDALGGGGRQTISVDVGHHVVADLFFPPAHGLVVDVGDVGLQLIHLLLRDGKAQLMLGAGQRDPQTPPGLIARIGGEETEHIIGGIAGRKGGFVTIGCHNRTSSAFNDLVALRADGDIFDGAAQRLFGKEDVILRGGGKLLEAADAADVALPAGEDGVDGTGLFQQRGEREVRGLDAVDLVMGADGDLFHVREDIQLGEGQLGGALHDHAVAGGHQIQRADPTGTAGGGAVFTAGLAELLRLFPEPFAGEGTFAHAGGIGLGDTQNPIDPAAGNACAHGGVGRDVVGGGGVGPDAEIQIPQSAQLGLEEDAFALGLGLTEEGAGVADEGGEVGAVAAHPGHHLVEGIGLGVIDVFNGEILPLQNTGKTAAEILGIEQLAGLDGLFLVFVAVNRRDAPLGGAVSPVLEAGLLQRVQIPVEGEDQRGAVGDAEVIRGDVDTGGAEIGDLLPKMLAVDDDAVAQHIDDTLAEDARGDQMKGELAVFVDDGVAGVVAALVADDHVVLLGDKVDHAAFALVAPVDAYDSAIGHVGSLLFILKKRLRNSYILIIL